MRLSRLGAFHQSRLSFTRLLTRRLAREQWQFERRQFEIDDRGVGHAVYTLHGPQRAYSLVAFAHDLPAESRSDRVIADAWDATFTLFDGVPDDTDIERLEQNVPNQEAGRITDSELSLSRANRSVRLWEHVVDALSQGRQPDNDLLQDVGYLMRTTAVYGSGKFGAADRSAIESRPEFAEPFQVEMMSVYLVRSFVRDLVEHMACLRGGDTAVRLSTSGARSLGIGNSTGLGMAPFMINHPVLFNNWIAAREEAISRVRHRAHATSAELRYFKKLLQRVRQSVGDWHTDHPGQASRIIELAHDLKTLDARVQDIDIKELHPWDKLYRWTEDKLSLEAQECLASLLMEPYPELVDDLSGGMSSSAPRTPVIDGSACVASICADIDRLYNWALDLDWSQRKHQARAWYVSEEKLEPRLGERFEEPIEAYEQPLAPARDAVALRQLLADWPDDQTIAAVLSAHPEHRHTVRRIQTIACKDYAEIRDNTIDALMQPIDLLRCKLSFFGATHFNPRSDRWLRICLYSGAPYPDELAGNDADCWVYPTVATDHPAPQP